VILYRQPIVSIHSGLISHYEILVRFLRNGEHILPTNFIPSLEKHSFVNLLDRRVVTNIIEHLCEAPEPNLYAVNISGQTINTDSQFVRFLIETLEPCNLKLMLEITESVPLQNSALVRSTLEYFINEPNLELALDDFGSGYFGVYSLDLGSRFIKIHGAFTHRLPDKKAMTDVRCITEMAHERSSQVILEWVETEDQKAWAKELGVDLIQGYLSGAPEPFILPKTYCGRCHIDCQSNPELKVLAPNALTQNTDKYKSIKTPYLLFLENKSKDKPAEPAEVTQDAEPIQNSSKGVCRLNPVEEVNNDND
jgi:EAL domain-containing protein (putative c-di-GMP-specific phosphodiesterase class I)